MKKKSNEIETIKSAIMLLVQGVMHEIGTDTAKDIARMLYPEITEPHTGG